MEQLKVVQVGSWEACIGVGLGGVLILELSTLVLKHMYTKK
jgi:hypothetical protein